MTVAWTRIYGRWCLGIEVDVNKIYKVNLQDLVRDWTWNKERDAKSLLISSQHNLIMDYYY